MTMHWCSMGRIIRQQTRLKSWRSFLGVSRWITLSWGSISNLLMWVELTLLRLLIKYLLLCLDYYFVVWIVWLSDLIRLIVIRTNLSVWAWWRLASNPIVRWHCLRSWKVFSKTIRNSFKTLNFWNYLFLTLITIWYTRLWWFANTLIVPLNRATAIGFL